MEVFYQEMYGHFAGLTKTGSNNEATKGGGGGFRCTPATIVSSFKFVFLQFTSSSTKKHKLI